MTLPRAALLLITLLAAACAPRVEGLGPAVQSPAIVEGGFEMADGFLLPADTALPEEEPEAVLLALHGFNDYRNTFAMPGAWWAKRGVTTYAVDQRGFGDHEHAGLWAGHERMARDARTAAAVIAARHPGAPLYLLGESMGGAVAMVARQGRSA